MVREGQEAANAGHVAAESVIGEHGSWKPERLRDLSWLVDIPEKNVAMPCIGDDGIVQYERMVGAVA